MRVLYADHTTKVSGAQRSLLELLRGLPSDVEAIVASPPGPLEDAAVAAGVAHVRIRPTAGSLKLHPVRTAQAMGELAWMARELGREAKRARADIVHSNTLQAGIAASLARRIGRRPLVVHVRDCLPTSGAGALVRRWIGSSADQLIAISNYTAKCFGPRVRTVIPNAVDLDRFDPTLADRNAVREELGLSTAPVLAAIAQITPWKGQLDAIEALALMRKADVDAHLLVVGETKFTFAATRYDNVTYMRELQELVAAHDLSDRVHFLGERDDIVNLLAATDVLLAPSWQEPFGRTIIEGMAMAVPVIATNVGGPNEIIDDGVDGLLLSPKTPDRWADAAVKLLSDGARRRSMGEAGRRKAIDRYSRAQHAARVVEVYDRLLA